MHKENNISESAAARELSSLAMVQEVVAEIMERPASGLEAGCRLVADLGCESIDLMEMAIRLSQKTGREVDDDALFLRSLRVTLAENSDRPADEVIAEACPWLGMDRVYQLARALESDASPAPLVTLGDMAAYMAFVRS